jgi:U11/U12 small nuclear ribonucleoprotein SNRNP65
LERIFGIFATDMTSFSVKLMKTGRMKDQAFVSYSTDSEAVRALQEANGFKFKEKPMVVLFSNSGN